MSNLITEYKESLLSYQTITSQFQNILSLLLQNEELHIHSIQGRAKNVKSLAGKIRKSNGKYKILQDITDLCGLRIITYYEDEIDEIASFIRSHFTVDEENSVDKRAQLAPDQFGYASLHLIVKVPIDKNGIHPNGTDYCNVEIQIRSVLQHAWAEIEHDLEYKNPAGTSAEVRRRFSRIAGLLECADNEFKALRDTLKKPALPALRPALSSLPSLKMPQPSLFKKFLTEFPNSGWAAGAALLFFVGSVICEHFINTKLEELSFLSTLFFFG